MELITLLCAALIIVVAIASWIQYRSRHRLVTEIRNNHYRKQSSEKDPYECIEPLDNFTWATASPIKLRPFKPKYHLTMGTENMTISELLAMDNTYLERIQLRKEIIRDHLPSTVQCNPNAAPAVRELYSWLLSTYLPRRFPNTYQLSPSDSLFNTATCTSLPLTPPPSPIDALRTLGENIDTDFLLLLPSPSPSPPPDPDQPTELYHLQAFVTCFPSGFSTRGKLGLPLAGIHAPVPGYQAKLAKSMDRFFARLPAGRAVRRANWTVTTAGPQLFCEAGNHLHDDDDDGHGNGSEGRDAEIERQRAAVRVEECRLRCERQTLHRLPNTGALVFAFKTYTYSLQEVKDEGSGEALAEAIEGLAKGNVPEFQWYKRGVVWGEKVVEFLRS